MSLPYEKLESEDDNAWAAAENDQERLAICHIYQAVIDSNPTDPGHMMAAPLLKLLTDSVLRSVEEAAARQPPLRSVTQDREPKRINRVHETKKIKQMPKKDMHLDDDNAFPNLARAAEIRKTQKKKGAPKK